MDSEAAKFNAIVDFPTPPFPLATAMIFFMLPSTLASLLLVSTVFLGAWSKTLTLISKLSILIFSDISFTNWFFFSSFDEEIARIMVIVLLSMTTSLTIPKETISLLKPG